MPTIAIVDPQEALGGLTSELVDRVVAYKPLNTYQTPSKWIPGTKETVLRTHAWGIDPSGALEDLGIRLIFWRVVQEQIHEATVAADLAIGVLTQSEQMTDPDKTVYTLQAPNPEEGAALVAALTD